MSAIDKIKEQWDRDPTSIVVIVGVAAAGLGKLIDAIGSIPSKRAYARTMNKRAGAPVRLPR